ncbi:MAG: GTP-binding protein [Bacteroidetes bacterium]|nr:GTP-binding protein [Bacteroidota bacterium]
MIEKKPVPVPLFLLTGFLGSGKTTLLNSLLAFYKDKKPGVIVNEFGELGIDRTVLSSRTGIVTTELNGGQIFCSCISGTFIDSIAEYNDKDIDVLFVEASGLAKPAPLIEIMQFADKKTQGNIEYKGMICVIDASRFEILSQTLLTIEEQIRYSNTFIINKTDLVEPEVIGRITKRIKELKPGAAIALTSFGEVDRDFLNMDFSPILIEKFDAEKYQGWGDEGRPIPVKIVPAKPVSFDSLESFITTIAPKSFRLKGFVETEDKGLVFVDCVADMIHIEPFYTSDIDTQPKPGLTVIFPGSSKEPERLFQNWRTATETGAFISV